VVITGCETFLLLVLRGYEPFVLVAVTGFEPFVLIVVTGYEPGPCGARERFFDGARPYHNAHGVSAGWKEGEGLGS
jgi:hypothetical protein